MDHSSVSSSLVLKQAQMDQVLKGGGILFIDLQGFFDNNKRFVVKELCYTTVSSHSEPKHFIFKPPYNWFNLNTKSKKSANYLTNFHHGLNWSDGCLNYRYVKTCKDMFEPSFA